MLASRIPTDAFVALVRGPALATAVTFALESTWRSAFVASGLSDQAFFTLALSVIHAGLYFGLNGLFLACDANGWLAEYKLPRTPAQQPSRALLLRTILPQVVMQLVVLPLTAYYVLFPFYTSRGAPSISSPLPSTTVAFLTILGCLVFNQWLFYIVHRLLHEYPALYRAIHKQHHEYTGSVGFAAEYAHPVEAILANTIPTIGFGLVAGIHPLIFCVWFMWRLEETYEAHSGYNFAKSPLGRIGLMHGHHAAHHDFHHSANVGNYGFAITDGLCGTMGAYEASGGEAGQWAAKQRLGKDL